jgi:hypothetical protein
MENRAAEALLWQPSMMRAGMRPHDCARHKHCGDGEGVWSAQLPGAATAGPGETADEVCYAGGRPQAAGGARRPERLRSARPRLGLIALVWPCA